jgi:hypothetical protein
MGRFVVAAFKPKTGRQEQLLAVFEKHWRVLQAQRLVTERPRASTFPSPRCRSPATRSANSMPCRSESAAGPHAAPGA